MLVFNPHVKRTALYMQRVREELLKTVQREYPLGVNVCFDEPRAGRRYGVVVAHTKLPGEIIVQLDTTRKRHKRVNVVDQPVQKMGYATGD